MDLVKKARRKAEAAYNELSALAADPDKRKAQAPVPYQHYHAYQTSNPGAPGYVGSGPVQWEQHQQNFRPPVGAAAPGQYGYQAPPVPPLQQQYGGPSPGNGYQVMPFQSSVPVQNQNHRYSVSSLPPPSHGQPHHVQPVQNQRYSISSPPPQSPPTHSQPSQSQPVLNHRYSISSAAPSHGQPESYFSPPSNNVHPNGFSPPPMHSQSPSPPHMTSPVIGQGGPPHHPSQSLQYGQRQPSISYQNHPNAQASVQGGQFSPAPVGRQDSVSYQPMVQTSQTFPNAYTQSHSQQTTPQQSPPPQIHQQQSYQQPPVPQSPYTQQVSPLTHSPPPPSMTPSQFPGPANFQPQQSPAPPPTSPPLPGQIWQSQTFPQSATPTSSPPANSPPLSQNHTPSQQNPIAPVPPQKVYENVLGAPETNVSVSPIQSTYSPPTQIQAFSPMSPTGTQQPGVQDSSRQNYFTASRPSDQYVPNVQVQASPPPPVSSGPPPLSRNEVHDTQSPSPQLLQTTSYSSQTVEELDTQMSALKLPTESHATQNELSAGRNDGYDYRELSPAPLQIKQKRYELSTANSFALELPGCNTFSSPSPNQDAVVELPGSHPHDGPPSSLQQPGGVVVSENTEILSQDGLDCTGSVATSTKHHQFNVLKACQEFALCQLCYHTQVVPNAHIRATIMPYQGDSPQLICNMSFPRVQSMFLSQCIPQNTIQPLLNFATLIPQLPACDGSVMHNSSPVYMTKGSMIADFTMCPTCFELYVKYTAFEKYFELVPQHDLQEWKCNMAMPYFKKMLKSELKKEPVDFASFVHEAKGRLQMPSCSGEGKPIGAMPDGQYLVLTAAGGKVGNICPACYCDTLAYTSLEGAFVPANLGPAQAGTITCDLAGTFTKVAMDVAIKKGEDEIWRTAVRLRGKLGPCVGASGINETDLKTDMAAQQGELVQWYQMKEYPSVECCPRCYHLVVALFGAAHLHVPITRQLVAGKVRQCVWAESAAPADASVQDQFNFENSTTWRGRMLRNCLAVGHETGDFTDLLAVAKIFNEQPPPCAGNARGFKRESGRKFFGRIAPNRDDPDDTTIVLCQECHWNFIDGTSFADTMSQDLTETVYAAANPAGVVFCQPYSRRAKQSLKEAAERGDLAQFARYWNEREERRKKCEAGQALLTQLDASQKVDDGFPSSEMLGRVGARDDADMRYGSSNMGLNHLTAGPSEAEISMRVASQMGVGGGDVEDVHVRRRKLWDLLEMDRKAYLAVE